MELAFENYGGTPVFSLPNDNPDLGRVHGAAFDRTRQRWLYPAYPPFADIVVADLKKVDPRLTLSTAAYDHLKMIAAIPQRIKDCALPLDFSYVTKPFDHQREGLAQVYHYLRFGLFWDPGVGKSKVLVDLARLLKNERMLILTPKVTVRNWIAQLKIHGPDLKAEAIDGDLSRKRKVITGYKGYDVLVASYGTARNMGFPRLHKETLEAIKTIRDKGKPISDSGLKELVRSIRVVGDKKRQLAYAEKWGQGLPVAQLKREAAAEAKATPQFICDIDYNIIVADESHCLMDITSQQTKTVLHLSRQAYRRYLMTGTPTLGDPRHLYPQMQFLSPSIFPENWFTFGDKFLIRSDFNKRIVLGFRNMHIINERVQRISARKKKEECLDLPERLIIDRPFELTAEQQRLYNTLVNSMGADLTQFFERPTGALIEVQNAATLLNKLAQISSGFLFDNVQKADACDGCPHVAKCVEQNIQPFTPRCQVIPEIPEGRINFTKENPKLDLLEELLDGILGEKGRKVIVWAYYKPSLELIHRLLDKKGIKHVVVDGSTGSKVQTRVDQFNNDPDTVVYLAQIATGVGITLNAATYMIYFETDWSLGTWLQSLDRNYRAGQTNRCTVYRLLGEGTVDMYKVRALDEKRDVSAILTNKLGCITCPRNLDCLVKNIELFDKGCIHQRSARRTVAKAEVIPS